MGIVLNVVGRDWEGLVGYWIDSGRGGWGYPEGKTTALAGEAYF